MVHAKPPLAPPIRLRSIARSGQALIKEGNMGYCTLTPGVLGLYYMSTAFGSRFTSLPNNNRKFAN